MWLKQCHVYHPPVITIFIGGITTTTKWVVYDIVLTSLCTSNNWAQRAKSLQCPRPPRGSMGIASPNAMVVKKNIQVSIIWVQQTAIV